MSWAIQITGTRDAVRREIQSNKNIPQIVKDLILSKVEEESKHPCGEHNGVSIIGFGHIWDGHTNSAQSSCELSIKPIKITS